MKSLEGKEKEMYERKQRIKAALAGEGRGRRVAFLDARHDTLVRCAAM